MKRFRRRAVGTGLIVAATAALVMAVGASASYGYSEFQVEGSGAAISGSGGTATLNSTSGDQVTCEKSSMVGEYEGDMELTTIVTYSGCHGEGPDVSGACTNVTGKEEIKTAELTVEPGEKLGGGSGVGVRFTQAKKELAKFKCEKTTLGSEVVVTGELVCENPNGGLSAPYSYTMEIVCAESAAGHQKFKEIEIGNTSYKSQELIVPLFGLRDESALATTENMTFSKRIRQT